MVDQTPWIPNLNRFLSLLDSGNKDVELDYEGGEDDADAYNESSDKEDFCIIMNIAIIVYELLIARWQTKINVNDIA